MIYIMTDYYEKNRYTLRHVHEKEFILKPPKGFSINI